MKKFLLTTILGFILLGSWSQDTSNVKKNRIPHFHYKNGLGMTTPDSTFSINFRFRVQSRLGYTSQSETNFTPKEFDFRIRRIRLRLDGFIYTTRLTYKVQLSFSRADMDWDISQVPNVLRDAAIAYELPIGLSLGMGQQKLPGNRQRVISSGEQQFADRSIVNNALTLDRDVGAFINFAQHIKNFHFAIKTAITGGEGRNFVSTDKGLAYTGRVEILPLGQFTGGGDYFEGDLMREKKPKLSLAATAHYNHLARRTQGQLGTSLYTPRNLFSVHADALLKYQGFALSSEYLYRSTDSAFTYNADGALRYVYVGQGVNTQASYCFKKMFEIALRHSILLPGKQLAIIENQKSEYALCVGKYFMKHRLKVQTDFTYHREHNPYKSVKNLNNYTWRFQVELGI